MKRRFFYILVLLVLAVALLFYIRSEDASTISFVNKTDKDVSTIEIKYSSENSWTRVGEVKARKVLKKKPTTPENFSEGDVKLRYQDNRGVYHSETIVGYTESAYDFNVIIYIEAIDKNGIMNFNIKDRSLV